MYITSLKVSGQASLISMVFSCLCCAAIVYRNLFFVFTKRINFLNLKQSSGRLVVVAKVFLKLPNLHILTKQKSLSLPRNLALRTLANSVIKKGKSGIPCQFNGPEVLAPASDKAKLFAENLSKNSDLDHSGITLPFFPSSLNVLSY